MLNPRTARGNALFAWITFASGAGFTLFGYDQGVFGAFLGNPNFISTFNNPSSTLQGHITATYDLGSFLGAIITMWLGNRWGSRKIILLGCMILIVGAVMQAASYHVPVLIVGRFVAGVGNGMNTAVVSKCCHHERLQC
jgi:MFS family permease